MSVCRMFLLALLVPTVGCGDRKPFRQDSEAMALILTDSTKAILAKASRVEVFLLDGEEGAPAEGPKMAGKRRLCGFRVTGQGEDQGKEFAGRLADILRDERAYSADYNKCFKPGVAFRVWGGRECVEVLICFACDDFYCGPPKEEARPLASFWRSPLRPELLRLVKEAFPDEKEIQALR